MAVTVPGAELQLANPVSTRRISPLVWIILHTIVGTVNGSLSGRHYHIYVRADGSFVQRQDLLLRSAASVEANPYSIAITAEDKGPAFPSWSGNDVPAYTAAQVDTIVRVLAWICKRFGIPPEAVRDSCLGNGPGSAWHRLGINGNFPLWPSIFRGRVAGCQLWSSSFGKGCPGNERIKQINNVIIPRVIAILRRAKEWDEMATKEEVRAECRAAVHEALDSQARRVFGIVNYEAYLEAALEAARGANREARGANDRVTDVVKRLTEHDSGHRVVKDGWAPGDPVYHSDLKTYIYQVRHNGPWDAFKQSLRTLAGLSPNALRLPGDVVDDMLSELPVVDIDTPPS